MMLMTVNFFIKNFAIKIYAVIMGNILFQKDLDHVNVLFFYCRIFISQLVYICRNVYQFQIGRRAFMGAKQRTNAINFGCFVCSCYDNMDGFWLCKPIFDQQGHECKTK